MRRLIQILLLSLLILSCQRDHIYYATSEQVVVRLNIDWSVSKFSPNGVTLYIYDSNGDIYGNSILSSEINELNFTLPADTYTFIVHNDSRSEFTNVEFINTDNLSTFMVRSLEWEHPYYEDTADEFVALEPDEIVSATLRGVTITGDVARYHYDKPDLTKYTSDEVVEVTMTPAYIVHLAEVQAHIDNAHNAVNIPIALVHGMSRGYYLGLECTSEDRVLEEFYIDVGIVTTSSTATSSMAVPLSRTDDDYTYEDDDIYVDFRTFGLPFDISDHENGDGDGDGIVDNLDNMHSVDDDFHDIYLELLFFMSDGLLYHIYADVTESTFIDNVGVQEKYIITLVDDLLNYEPYYDETFTTDNDDLNEEATDPSLDNWVDIVIPMPI